MRAALAFLTCLGGPAPATSRALPWFPVVGAGLGLALGGLWGIAHGLWPPLLAAAVVVAVDQALVGMLHLDGLADSADGLLAHGLDPARRLAVMAEPTTGAFALGVVMLVLMVRVAALAALVPSPVLLAALWSTSRTIMAIAVLTQPYARGQGLATSFQDVRSKDVRSQDVRSRGRRAWGGPVTLVAVTFGLVVIVSVLVTWWDGGNIGVGGIGLSAGAACLAGVTVLALARRRIGGYTGDVLGAVGMVAETAGLVVAATRW